MSPFTAGINNQTCNAVLCVAAAARARSAVTDSASETKPCAQEEGGRSSSVSWAYTLTLFAVILFGVTGTLQAGHSDVLKWEGHGSIC